MAQRARDSADEELTGEVADVVFTNAATGFGVVELMDPTGREGPRAAGPLAGLVPGQPVRLRGAWSEHERYGRTFRAVYYELADPRTTDGLAAFLASDRFPGVGPTIADRLVAAHGLQLGAVIETDAQQLARVKGVSSDLAVRIANSWRDAGALAHLVARLAAVGLPAAVAGSVHQRFGQQAEALLNEDPYTLLDVHGVRWPHVEALGREAGISRSDPRRLSAGAVTALKDACERNGHMTFDESALLEATRRLLGCDGLDARRALDLAAGEGRLTSDEGFWYLPGYLEAERGLAHELARVRSAVSRIARAAEEHDLDPRLTSEQAAAVRAALRWPLSVLTGGPGTGKTRTVVELVRVFTAAGLRVGLCAPTGRAAKRLEELTSHGATTVHRLLEAQPTAEEDTAFRFGYGVHRRLPHDVIIADEWSMADTRLAYALVSAIGDGAHLILVGDADQLPSVGPGAVLRDLLDPRVSGGPQPVVPATELTQVHRQAARSRIVTLAHEINAGTAPVPRGRDVDVFAVPQAMNGLADRVAEIVAVRAPEYFGCGPADVQVLAPMYRGPGGVDELNRQLKGRLNPARGRPTVGGFHEGDRVVQTRNDTDLDVANGDIGEVSAIDLQAHVLEVVFPWGPVVYDRKHARDLAPAWCLTVHKAQGGEWPVVILSLDPTHRPMLWRELVYTAVTRAAAGLLLVGEPGLLAAASRRAGSGLQLRRTRLPERLAAAACR